MKIYKIRLVSSGAFFLFLTSLMSPCKAQAQNERWLTVFVHGNFGAHLTILDFNAALKDSFDEKSRYQKIQQRQRAYEKTRQTRFLPPLGLLKIDLNQNIDGKNSDPVSYALAKTYQDITKLANPEQSDNTVYYSFGWNGLLSQTARRQEAIVFYQLLSKEIARYAQEGITPKIRIICHSHGGNVSLNLASVYAALNGEQLQDKKTKIAILKTAQEIAKQDVLPTLNRELKVDELIMLATPIQEETEGFAASKFFKKVLSVHSCNDIVQVIDVVSTDGPLSNRTINKNLLSENITEIQYSVENHIEPAKQNPFFSFIKNHLRLSKSKKIKETEQKKHLFKTITTLIASVVTRTEKNGFLASMEQMISWISSLAKIPKEKDFDHDALDKMLEKIQLNMQKHPDDPSHDDFVSIVPHKKNLIVDPLPLLVWTPLVCHLLGQRPGSDAHTTIHYYAKTLAIEVENSSEKKLIEISAKQLLELKKKFFGYLVNSKPLHEAEDCSNLNNTK